MAARNHRFFSLYWPYLLIFFMAIGFRVLHLVFIDGSSIFGKYPFFAEKLARGEDIGTRLVDLSPFYLYFMTLLKKVFHMDWAHVKILQATVGSANCVLLYMVGIRFFTREVGLLAACMMAIYGNLIVLESTLEPTVFVLSFSLITIYFLSGVEKKGELPRRGMGLAVLAGLFAGLTIITKPNFLLFLPIGAFWLCIRRKQVRGLYRFFSAFLFLSAALLVVLPITLRNHVMLNDFVLVTADGGKVFFHGNGPGGTALEGTGLPDEGFSEEAAKEPDYAHVLFRQTANRLTGKTLLPSEASRFWARRAFEHIAENPKGHIILVLKKLFYFFNDYEMHYIASAYNEYKQTLAFPFLRFGVISALGLLGAFFAARQFRRYFLLYGVVVIYMFTCLFFLVQSRYRMPAVPFLSLFAGYAVVLIKSNVLQKRYRHVALSLATLSLLFVLTSLAFRGEIQRVDQWQLATKAYYQETAQPLFQRRQYQDAITALNKCISILPDFGPALNLRGRALAAVGDYERARKDFEKVVALSPQIPYPYEHLGFIHILQGNKAQALVYLKKAMALDPENQRVKEALQSLE